MTNLPFSERTTAAVTVFACLFAASNALLLTTNGVQKGALSLEHAQLFSIYRQLIHQDVANQHAVLEDIITNAATIIGNLNTTVQAITPTPQNQIALADLKILVANAVQVMVNIEAA